jgi:hypothetical protein
MSFQPFSKNAFFAAQLDALQSKMQRAKSQLHDLSNRILPQSKSTSSFTSTSNSNSNSKSALQPTKLMRDMQDKFQSTVTHISQQTRDQVSDTLQQAKDKVETHQQQATQVVRSILSPFLRPPLFFLSSLHSYVDAAVFLGTFVLTVQILPLPYALGAAALLVVVRWTRRLRATLRPLWLMVPLMGFTWAAGEVYRLLTPENRRPAWMQRLDTIILPRKPSPSE